MKKPRTVTPTVVVSLDRVLGYADAMRAGYSADALLRSDAYIQGMADYLWCTKRSSYYVLFAEYQAAKAARQ